MPRVISPHNNYWFWGPGDEGGTLIVIGGRRGDMDAAFENVEEVARTRCDYCMPYENDLAIRIGRGWKVRLSDVWSREREFDQRHPGDFVPRTPLHARLRGPYAPRRSRGSLAAARSHCLLAR